MGMLNERYFENVLVEKKKESGMYYDIFQDAEQNTSK